MHQLYDFGYQSLKRSADLLAYAEKINAVVVDIRFSPKSKDPQWAGLNLEKQFGERYTHLKELGNQNYKGTTIELLDQENGLTILRAILDIQPVILMCACWDRKSCHRKTVSRLAELKWKIQVIPLQPADIRSAIASEKEPEPEQDQIKPDLTQGGLF